MIIKLHVKDEDSKEIKERASECEMETIPNDLPPLEIDESKSSRRLTEQDFKPFKIYIDLSYMKYQASLDPQLSKNFMEVVASMEKAKNTLEKLFMVKPFEKNWVVTFFVIDKLLRNSFNHLK